MKSHNNFKNWQILLLLAEQELFMEKATQLHLSTFKIKLRMTQQKTLQDQFLINNYLNLQTLIALNFGLPSLFNT